MEKPERFKQSHGSCQERRGGLPLEIFFLSPSMTYSGSRKPCPRLSFFFSLRSTGAYLADVKMCSDVAVASRANFSSLLLNTQLPMVLQSYGVKELFMILGNKAKSVVDRVTSVGDDRETSTPVLPRL